MFSAIAKKIFGTKQDRDLKELKPIVQQINQLESSMKALSDEELKAQTPKLKQQLEMGQNLDDILPEAFATVREASFRVMKMRHFDVQLMGGITLHKGRIAEMKTGEGKTLTATLALYLNALAGKGVHLVTANDYLARRDGMEMGKLYTWLGLSVGIILNELDDEERKTAYASDITYGTNNEFAFDYLRDNMKFRLDQYVQREHFFCIVDEVDSILIDEARTPLLISGPSEGNVQAYVNANKIIPQLERNKDYSVDEKTRTAILTEEGTSKVQNLLKIDNLYEIQHVGTLHALHQSLKAHTLFTKDVDYVVRKNAVIIVDEFTGRLKEGSRWSDGLHQAVEAKENVPLKSENQTLATITFQNYFRLYAKLAGMTGTADTEAEEFSKIYHLDVVVIPTHLPMIRKDHADVIYATKKGKYKAVSGLIKELNDKGQPVLVGTISIESSELLSQFLKQQHVPHQVLNAKQHEKEAEIITKAGEKYAVTIATNMAGRGTDIKLTSETVNLGGLYIIGTERHESRRIDNQLRGRSGRQGDAGASKFFLSLEDDLLRIFGSDRIKGIMGRLGMNDDEPIEHKMITNAIAKAQKKVEAHNFDIRKHLLDYDNVMNEQRKVIYTLRRSILKDEENMLLIKDMIDEVCEFLEELHRPEEKVDLSQWPWEKINTAFHTTFHITESTPIVINYEACLKEYAGDLLDYLQKTAKHLLEVKFSKHDPSEVDSAAREILLNVLDAHWKDHLLNMDHLKEGINLRAYAQRDPLNEYKRESFRLFEEMRLEVKKGVVDSIFSVHIYTKEEMEYLREQHEAFLKEQMEAHHHMEEQRKLEEMRMLKLKNQMSQNKPVSKNEEGEDSSVDADNNSTEKLGRNEPCNCGSGKKFKHCHGA